MDLIIFSWFKINFREDGDPPKDKNSAVIFKNSTSPDAANLCSVCGRNENRPKLFKFDNCAHALYLCENPSCFVERCPAKCPSNSLAEIRIIEKI